MSDTEAAPVVEEVAAEEVPAGEEAQPELVLPKERVKKPVRPDDTTLKAATDLLHEQIAKNKQRVQQIVQIIEDRKAGRGEGSKEQQAIKSKLAELKSQFQGSLSQKQALRAQLETARKTRETVRASLRDLKSNMKFTTVDDIDKAIAKLEERVNHSTLTLNEEKRILDDIKKLKQSRATVGQISEKAAQLAQDESATDDIMGRLKALDEELNKIKAQEEELRGQLAELREKEAAKSSDIPSLIQEREECREICKQAYEKIKDLRAEHNTKWEEYKQQMQLFNLQRQEDRKRKQEAYLTERARRDAERAARMAELAGEPFDKEVTMCEQVLNYLARFVATEAAAAEEKKAEVAAPEGLKLFAKKEADEDSWIMGGVGKKGGKGGKGKGGKKADSKPAAPADEKLVHSLDILEAFTTLKVEVPLTRSKVPAVLDNVRAKKEHFLQKRQEVNENGVPAMEPKEDEEEGEGEGSGEGEGAAAGEGEAAAGEAAAADSAAAPKKGGKGGKANGKVAPAALNLDDDSSWPSMSAAAGGAPAAAAAAAPAAAEEPEEASQEAEAKPAQGDDGVSVSLTVSGEEGEKQSVSVAIQAN